MRDIVRVSVHVSGARHAWHVPLDVRMLRHTLLCMVECVLQYDRLDTSEHDRTVPLIDSRPASLLHDNSALSGVELSLTLVRDATALSVNAAHLACFSPTNILSFPLYMPAKAGFLTPPAGDMLLAVDTLRREAFLYGQTPSVYVISLMAHGVAHLAGLEHGEFMTCLEQTLCACAL